MKYKVIDEETRKVMMEKGIFPAYIKLECQHCSSSWGITLDPGRNLTEKDLVCKNCMWLEALKSFESK